MDKNDILCYIIYVQVNPLCVHPILANCHTIDN